MARGVKFRWSRAGYQAVLDSDGVQSMVADVAQAIADRAGSMLDQDEGYELDDFEVKDFHGKLARGKVVRTKTDHARYSQAKSKTLTKAKNSMRAG